MPLLLGGMTAWAQDPPKEPEKIDAVTPKVEPAKPAAKPTGAELSAEQAAALAKTLREVEAQLHAAQGKTSTAAMAAFQAAMASDDKAYALFMECTKQVDFEEKGKTGSEFGDWKRRDDVKALHDNEYCLVLRLQLHWLVLTIQANNAKTESAYAAVVAQIPTYLDNLHQAWKRMKTYRYELNKEVFSTVFARFYKLDRILQPRDRWNNNPMSIDSIYDQVVLPFFRVQKNGAAAAASWKKRIDMLTDFLEIEEREVKKDAKNHIEERMILFKHDKYPRLQWGMLKDAFQLGNEPTAATQMLAHVRSHLGHRDCQIWINELDRLIKREKVGPTVVGDDIRGTEPDPLGKNKDGSRNKTNVNNVK